MTETHDVTLTGGGFDFRVRVYPAADPNGSVLVWLHGGGFMFGTLEMPEADQVGQRLSARGTTVVSVDYTLAPLDALATLPPAEPGDGMPDAGGDGGGVRCRRASCAVPRRLAPDRRRLRLGRRARGRVGRVR